MATVLLTLTNRSTRSATFALEPLGDYCELANGQSVTAVYDTTDVAPHLDLTFDDSGLSVCEESGGGHGLAPVRHARGGEHWA